MEGDIQRFLLDFIRSLNIENCDTYLVRPKIVGNQEKRKRSYVCIGYPNGIEYLGAFARAEGMITIGTKDKQDALGLPNAGEITRISDVIQQGFANVSGKWIALENSQTEFQVMDYEFSSDDDNNDMGWHEYYYSFQIYINKPN